jgi:hypothetical protein
MATGVALSKLVKDLRAECRHSLSVAQGQATEETLRYYINRVQQELYVGYEWPALKLNRTVNLFNTQRYYDYPTDIPFERVTQVWAHTKNSTDWRLLPKGITPADFMVYDSNAGICAFPPQKWEHHVDTNQIELWPIPSTDTGELWVYGLKPCPDMLKAEDVCTLDGTLIVLFAAVEIIQSTDEAASQLKMQKAQRHLQRILGQQGARKRAWTSLTGQPKPHGVVGLDYIPQGYTYPGQTT